MTIYVIATSISALVSAGALTVLLADRTARARAWRRIADERRWNHDRRTAAAQDRSDEEAFTMPGWATDR